MKTFTETYGTIFYGKRTSEREELGTPAIITKGKRISTLSWVKAYKMAKANTMVKRSKGNVSQGHQTVEIGLFVPRDLARQRFASGTALKLTRQPQGNGTSPGVD